MPSSSRSYIHLRRAVDRVLAAPELLHMVTEELKEPTSSNMQALNHLASTCRSLCSPALDVLWPHQIGLRPILCTIPQVKDAYDQWCETPRRSAEAYYDYATDRYIPTLTPTRIIERTDLDRLLNVYAPRIQSFCLGTYESHLEAIPCQEIIRALLSTSLPLFPRLLRFECTNPRPPWISLVSLLPDYHLFLSGTMLQLKVDNLLIDEQARCMIADLPRLCPRLEVLGINDLNDSVHLPLAEPLLPPNFFLSLPALRSVEIGHALPASVFKDLRSLPNLNLLYFVPSGYLPGRDTLPYVPFANLTDLRLDGGCGSDSGDYDSAFESPYSSHHSAQECASLLATSSFPKLETLCITAGEVGSFGVITRIVATHCPSTTLKEVMIERDNALRSFHFRDPAVTADDVEPLYAFEQLECVSLQDLHNFLLTDDDFLKMALAWPNLRSLSLIPEPTLLESGGLGYHMERAPYPTATLRSLVHFARHCPDLEVLHIRLATDRPDGASIVRQMEVNREKIPKSDLAHLDMSHGLPRGDRDEVKVMLDAIFPQLEDFYWVTDKYVEETFM